MATKLVERFGLFFFIIIFLVSPHRFTANERKWKNNKQKKEPTAGLETLRTKNKTRSETLPTVETRRRRCRTAGTSGGGGGGGKEPIQS